MASGPHFDKRRGAWYVRWFNGRVWTNKTVAKIPRWKEGSPRPKKAPPEAMAAVKTYADKEAAARAGTLGDPARPIAAFLDDYRIGYALEKAEGSAIQLAQAARNFLGWCGAQKLTRLDQLTPGICQKFLDWRAGQISRKTGKPISPKRLHLERCILAGAWARAVKLGTLAANPWPPTAAPGWARDRKRSVKLPSWTPEEFERLMAVSNGWLRDMLTLGTQTGLRIGALTAVEWRDVSWSKEEGDFGSLRVRPELDKAGKGYTVPLSPKAHDLLARLSTARDPRRKYILSAMKGGKIATCAADEAIRAACRRAGLGEVKSPNHMMRRTFGRWAVHGQLIGVPIPVYVVSQWLGHSDIKMTQHYLDINDADSRSWMSRGMATQALPRENDLAGQNPSST